MSTTAAMIPKRSPGSPVGTLVRNSMEAPALQVAHIHTNPTSHDECMYGVWEYQHAFVNETFVPGRALLDQQWVPRIATLVVLAKR